MEPVSEEYILKQLKSLSESKATGTDEIPSKLLKIACNSIVTPITHIINRSILSSVYPDKWKSARISPIFKNGDGSDVNNYRPISILPVISKLLERSVFDQMYPFLNSKGLIHDRQSGFRPKHSTCTALVNVTEDWYDSIDKGEYIGVVMLDLKKAFDTVSHDILVKKLSNYDISQQCVKWIGSYLSERRHITCVNGVKSESSICSCGVPQGSILGPLFFIIYINDLPRVAKNVKVSMYADDTVLYTSSKCINTVVNALNEDLCYVNEWLIDNKLSLNVSKSEVMIMGTRHKVSNIDRSDVNVNVNGLRLQYVNTCKHLGVLIDDKLTWHDQIDKVRKQVLFGSYMLRKASYFIPSHTLKMLYNSIVAPHFDYCDIVWNTCGETDKEKLQRLQNRCAKIINGARYDSSATEALAILNWDPLKDRVQYHESLTMYKIMNGLTPIYVKDRFKIKDSGYMLRGYKTLSIPKPRTEFKKRSLSYRGAILWNNMPTEIKQARDVECFKKFYAAL